MLSRTELERITVLLASRLAGAHLDRIVQRDAVRLELDFRLRPRDDGGSREHLLLVLSADPRTARVGEQEHSHPAPPAPLGFAQLLRARVGRGRVAGVTQAPGERQLELTLSAGGAAFVLLLQILGPRSNVFLLDEARHVLGALRPLPETRRDLAIGAAFSPLETSPPPAGDDRFALVADDALLVAIETHYAEREGAQRTDTLVRRITRALDRERARLARREEALRRDLQRLRPAEEQRRAGELLKGALHTVKPGLESVRVRDYATDQDVVIPLDPARSAAQNLEKLFARYQRARRREQATAEQLAALSAQRDALAALRIGFDAIAADDGTEVEALTRFAGRVEVARLLSRHPLPGEGARPQSQAPRAGRRAAVPARLRPGRYRTSDALEIWVGRSAEGNDHLTTRLARGNDLFLHVEGSPGSHVVLRLAGRKEAPQESLLEAAELAVHFSKQKHAARATVHVAPIRDVRKPAGAKPGLVQVTRGRTLSLRRDTGRLTRILEARIEDDAGA